MIKAILQFLLRLLGIGEQAALDHASEALPDEDIYIQLDNALIDPPFSFNAELHAEIEKQEDLDRVLRFLQLCEMTAWLAVDIECEAPGVSTADNDERKKMSDQLSLMNEYVDELRAIIADFHFVDVNGTGAWSDHSFSLSNEQDIADEWLYIVTPNHHEALLHAFYPDKYEEPACGVPELYRVEDIATAGWTR
jgi:hypothetical protein